MNSIKLYLLFLLFGYTFNMYAQINENTLIGVWRFKSKIDKQHFTLSKEDSLNFKDVGYQFLEEERVLIRHVKNAKICMLSDIRFTNYKACNWKLTNNILTITWKKNTQNIIEKWKVLKVSGQQLEVIILSD